ncbi:MAG: SRPBCC family protein [Nitrososphaerota archaeon]
MNSVTESCVVSASKDQVFGFLSNIENLPKWSTQFVKKIIKANGKLKALTPIGKVLIRLEADQKTGTIDIYAGSTEKQMTGAFLRVVQLSASSTGVIFTFFQYPDIDDKTWQVFCEWIKIEVGNIKKIFPAAA